jgi:alpha-glucosidase/alpha-D-xyloside xylohydrolase
MRRVSANRCTTRSQQFRPNERAFALHRNGYAGMQRYAAFLWSGDVYSTWETLKTHVPVAVNTGLSGIPFWGTDIGGFVPTEYTGELQCAFQLAFCPSSRTAHRHLRLPWDGPESWASTIASYTGGAANPNPDALHAARSPSVAALGSRHRLLPLHESAATRACRSRALAAPCDDLAAVVRRPALGAATPVAPVTQKGATSRHASATRRVVDF